MKRRNERGLFSKLQDRSPQESQSRFTAYSSSDVMIAVPMWGFEDPPPMKWVVDGVIPEGYVTILGADGGTGKSYLALELMYCVATDTPFFGRDVVAGNVLFVDFELAEVDQKRRWVQVLKGHSIDQYKESLEDGVFFAKPTRPLSDHRMVDDLVEICADKDISFVVIDSLTIGLGADAKSQEEITNALRSLDRLPTVLAIDHVSKAVSQGSIATASVYGSVMKRNMARSLLMLAKTDGGGLVLRQNKTNFGREQDLMCYELVFDESATSVRFISRELTDDVMAGAISSLKTHEITLLGLRSVRAETGQIVSPEEIATWRRDQGVEVVTATVRNHLSQLRNNGLAENVGSNSWIPTGTTQSSSSLSIGAVISDHTVKPTFEAGFRVNTPDGLGVVEETPGFPEESVQVRLGLTGEIKYFAREVLSGTI